jgi:hypothetical protein
MILYNEVEAVPHVGRHINVADGARNFKGFVAKFHKKDERKIVLYFVFRKYVL